MEQNKQFYFTLADYRKDFPEYKNDKEKLRNVAKRLIYWEIIGFIKSQEEMGLMKEYLDEMAGTDEDDRKMMNEEFGKVLIDLTKNACDITSERGEFIENHNPSRTEGESS